MTERIQVLYVPCQRTGNAPNDLAHIYCCYQCRASFFAGKPLNKSETEGPGNVRCPMVEEK